MGREARVASSAPPACRRWWWSLRLWCSSCAPAPLCTRTSCPTAVSCRRACVVTGHPPRVSHNGHVAAAAAAVRGTESGHGGRGCRSAGTRSGCSSFSPSSPSSPSSSSCISLRESQGTQPMSTQRCRQPCAVWRGVTASRSAPLPPSSSSTSSSPATATTTGGGQQRQPRQQPQPLPTGESARAHAREEEGVLGGGVALQEHKVPVATLGGGAQQLTQRPPMWVGQKREPRRATAGGWCIGEERDTSATAGAADFFKKKTKHDAHMLFCIMSGGGSKRAPQAAKEVR